MTRALLLIILIGLVGCSPSTEDMLKESRRLLDERNAVDALTYLEKVIEEESGNFDGHNMKGTAHFMLEDFEEAIREWQIAILLDSSSYKPYYNMGNALLELESFEEATIKYSRAISLKPNVVDLYINRGSTLYELERFEEALNDFQFALELDNDNPLLLINAGKTLVRTFKIDQAKEYFQKARQLDNSRGEIFYWLGYISFNQGNKEEGCRYLGTAVRLNFEPAKEAQQKACQGAS